MPKPFWLKCLNKLLKPRCSIKCLNKKHVDSPGLKICPKAIAPPERSPTIIQAWTSFTYFNPAPFSLTTILGNLEEFGVLKNSGGDISRDHHVCHGSPGDDTNVPAVIEFGAGRGYLTQMLADCYGIKKVFLVERKSYKLKVS